MSSSVAADLPTRPHHTIWPRRLPRRIVAPATSLWVNLEVAARRYPDKAAYVFFGRRTSYVELHRDAETIAGWLQSVGVQAGDRVGIYLQNCPQFVVALYAIYRANAVAVPVNPMNRADEFGHYITDPECPGGRSAAADLAGDRRRRPMPGTARSANG